MPAVSSGVSMTRVSSGRPAALHLHAAGHRGQEASGDHPHCAPGHPSTLAHLIPAGPARYSSGVPGSPWAGSLSSPIGCLPPERLSARAPSQAWWNQRPVNWPA